MANPSDTELSKDHDEPELIEVGEAGDTLGLYEARILFANAKDEQVYLETGVQRLKTRATNLLGWSITLFVAALAAFQYAAPQFRILLMISIILYTLIVWICAYTLTTTKWRNTFYNKTMLREMNCYSELEYLDQMTVDIKYINEQNDIIFSHLFRTMQKAWWLFAIVPAIAAVFSITTFILG